jgi:hypothetical protein
MQDESVNVQQTAEVGKPFVGPAKHRLDNRCRIPYPRAPWTSDFATGPRW